MNFNVKKKISFSFLETAAFTSIFALFYVIPSQQQQPWGAKYILISYRRYILFIPFIDVDESRFLKKKRF